MWPSLWVFGSGRSAIIQEECTISHWAVQQARCRVLGSIPSSNRSTSCSTTHEMTRGKLKNFEHLQWVRAIDWRDKEKEIIVLKYGISSFILLFMLAISSFYFYFLLFLSLYKIKGRKQSIWKTNFFSPLLLSKSLEFQWIQG